MQPLEGLSTPALLQSYGVILTILREGGITRTEDSPVGGYAEHLASRAFGLTLRTNSASGHDGTDAVGDRYQVKGRRMTRWNPSRQMSAIRGLEEGKLDPFEWLVGIVFHADMSVVRAAMLPLEVVRAQSTRPSTRERVPVSPSRLSVVDSRGVRRDRRHPG